MDEQQEAISQFCSITGVQIERARFFLESANWDLSLAMASFYENGEQGIDESENVESDAVPTNATVAQSEESGLRQSGISRVGQPQSTSRFQTLAAMRASEESPDSEEEGQAYYAGNSRESGQQILGPGKHKKEGDHMAASLFKAAKEAGAETVDRSSKPGTRGGAQNFSGTGYRLGESEGEPSVQFTSPDKPKQLHVVLKLYKTGFTVNDEELRLFEDPKSRPFLDSIRHGQIPVELASRAHGGEVSVDMEDHRDEDYVPPKAPRYQAFVGQGQALGGDQPGMSSTMTDAAPSLVTVDESKPTTSVQIRLADGSRLVVKLNHTHTVGDLRRHIVASRPQYAQVPFSLSAAFPPKPLINNSLTLKQADLMNAAVLQKL